MRAAVNAAMEGIWGNGVIRGQMSAGFRSLKRQLAQRWTPGGVSPSVARANQRRCPPEGLIFSPGLPAPVLHRVPGKRLFFPGPGAAAASGRFCDPNRSGGVDATGVPESGRPMSACAGLPTGAGRRCPSCLFVVPPFLPASAPRRSQLKFTKQLP